MSCCNNVEDVLEPAIFKALGDPRRITLLAYLCQCQGPCQVTPLAEVAGIDVSVVSRHLAMLRDAGILQAEKRGKEVFYTVRYSALSHSLRTMADAIDACCPEETPAASCCTPQQEASP